MLQQKLNLILAMIICVGLHVSTKGDDAQQFKIPKLPVVAHRGFSAEFPENTVAAIKAAIDAKADGSEFDVRATADGVLILLHDASLNRTTNIKSEIVDGKPEQINASTLTFKEIRALDAGSWKSPKFSGEKIPTLDEALAAFKGSKCWPVIEIKEDGIEGKVIDAVKKAGLQNRAIIIAFSKNSVKAVRKIDPKFPVAWLWGKKWEKGDDALTEMLLSEANDVGTVLLDLSHGDTPVSVIEALQKKGITVWAWTVDDAEKMKVLCDAGVASITTNRPDVAKSVLQQVQKDNL